MTTPIPSPPSSPEMIARLERLGNLVAQLAHPNDDHCENEFEDEAHDIIRELRAALAAAPVEPEKMDDQWRTWYAEPCQCCTSNLGPLSPYKFCQHGHEFKMDAPVEPAPTKEQLESKWWVCFHCWIAYCVPTTGYYGKCQSCNKDTRRWPADPLTTLRMTEWTRKATPSRAPSTEPAPMKDDEWPFKAGFQAGVNSVDKYGESQETAAEAYASYLAATPSPAPGEPQGWQPIETAPKDGRWILVTSVHNPYANGVMQWVDGDWLDWQDHIVRTEAITHWMPLPPPPGEPGEPR
jgi:hypothetical protein